MTRVRGIDDPALGGSVGSVFRFNTGGRDGRRRRVNATVFRWRACLGNLYGPRFLRQVRENEMIQKSLLDIRFERAMRWTRNRAGDGHPPPAHIAEKIAAVAPHMKREEEADG